MEKVASNPVLTVIACSVFLLTMVAVIVIFLVKKKKEKDTPSS